MTFKISLDITKVDVLKPHAIKVECGRLEDHAWIVYGDVDVPANVVAEAAAIFKKAVHVWAISPEATINMITTCRVYPKDIAKYPLSNLTIESDGVCSLTLSAVSRITGIHSISGQFQLVQEAGIL